MEYLEHVTSYEEIKIGWDRYQEYLERIEDEFPANVRSFAKAPWHYDPAHHWCPHDSWVEELVIKEQSGDDEKGTRGITIHLRLLGAYHDGYTTLTYSGVYQYRLSLQADKSRRRYRGHKRLADRRDSTVGPKARRP